MINNLPIHSLKAFLRDKRFMHRVMSVTVLCLMVILSGVLLYKQQDKEYQEVQGNVYAANARLAKPIRKFTPTPTPTVAPTLALTPTPTPSPMQSPVSGRRLLVNGSAYYVRGWNYVNTPIGMSLGRSFAKEVGQVPIDMQDMRAGGARTVRVYYDGYDYNEYKQALDSANANNIKVIMFLWVPHDTNYSKASGQANRTAQIDRFVGMINNLKYHSAIIGWGFGNEVNYHLGATPKADWFTLLNEAISTAKQTDNTRFYTTANGEVADIAAHNSLVPAIDVWGANIYRNRTLGTLRQDVLNATSRPFLITEMGFDRYAGSEDEAGQAERNVALAKEAESYSDVIAGYLMFAWADEWAKWGDANTQDTGGWTLDHDDRDKMMNEDWFGSSQALPSGSATSRVKMQSYTSLKTHWATATPY
jgi:hypothetical protein